jgi:hypothetical protein
MKAHTRVCAGERFSAVEKGSSSLVSWGACLMPPLSAAARSQAGCAAAAEPLAA